MPRTLAKQMHEQDALAPCQLLPGGKRTIVECEHLGWRENGRPVASCTLANGRTAVAVANHWKKQAWLIQ